MEEAASSDSLVYTASSRQTQAIQRDLTSETNRKTSKNKKLECYKYQSNKDATKYSCNLVQLSLKSLNWKKQNKTKKKISKIIAKTYAHSTYTSLVKNDL